MKQIFDRWIDGIYAKKAQSKLMIRSTEQTRLS